jgi:hypothetical protein
MGRYKSRRRARSSSGPDWIDLFPRHSGNTPYHLFDRIKFPRPLLTVRPAWHVPEGAAFEKCGVPEAQRNYDLKRPFPLPPVRWAVEKGLVGSPARHCIVTGYPCTPGHGCYRVGSPVDHHWITLEALPCEGWLGRALGGHLKTEVLCSYLSTFGVIWDYKKSAQSSRNIYYAWQPRSEADVNETYRTVRDSLGHGHGHPNSNRVSITDGPWRGREGIYLGNVSGYMGYVGVEIRDGSTNLEAYTLYRYLRFLG